MTPPPTPDSGHTEIPTSMATLWTVLALVLLFILTLAPSAQAAIDRTVSVEIQGHPTAFEVTWTPRSALPGAFRLYAEYQLEVSTNLVDWKAMGALEPQRLGGPVQPISRSVTNATGEPIYVRVVDRLDLQKRWFFQLLNLDGEVDLRGADLRGANMDDALLGGGFFFDGADLSNATLRRASVGYATFRGANLTGANVIGASFYGTDLTGANFAHVDAREAVFGAAILNHLNVEHANLRDAREFDDTVPGIRFLNTILPDGPVRSD